MCDWSEINFKSTTGRGIYGLDAKVVLLLETRKVPTQCGIYHIYVVSDIVTGECLLERLLSFTTGLDRVPPLGFDPQMTLSFLHDGGQFPVANTCANILNIPLLPDYGTFYQHMCAAITMCSTFTKE
jgi:HECT-domain (ubiquitin-transferase)